MSDSSSSASDPFAGLGGMPGLHPRGNDPNFEMTYSRVRSLGASVGSYGQDLSLMSDKTRAIDMPALTFGVVGGGLNVAHRSVRDSAADALMQGMKVLESWKEALSNAADNTEQAEQASKAPSKDGLTPPELPGGVGMKPMGGLPGAGDLGGLGKGTPGLEGLGKIDQPSPGDIKQPDLDGIKQPSPGDVKQPDLDGIKQPSPGDVKQPDLDGIKQPDLKTPDPGGVKQPDVTDLAGVDPRVSTPTMPQVQVPDSTTADPRGSMPRASAGLPDGGVGGASAGAGAGSQAAAGQGSLSRALNSGMPLYPMTPGGAGAGAGSEERDRERGAHLAEDEGVWGGDEDIAPTVLGREE